MAVALSDVSCEGNLSRFNGREATKSLHEFLPMLQRSAKSEDAGGGVLFGQMFIGNTLIEQSIAVSFLMLVTAKSKEEGCMAEEWARGGASALVAVDVDEKRLHYPLSLLSLRMTLSGISLRPSFR